MISGAIDHAYDLVIVAAPLEVPKSNLKCDQCTDWPNEETLSGKYQQTIATFVQGSIDYSYFNTIKNSPSDIFTIEDAKIPFNSIGKYVDTVWLYV